METTAFLARTRVEFMPIQHAAHLPGVVSIWSDEAECFLLLRDHSDARLTAARQALTKVVVEQV